MLTQPLLYLSLYFKQHRSDDYELLNRVRTVSDWETWLEFFSGGVSEAADSAVRTAKKLSDLIAADRQKLQLLGRPAGSALRVHQALLEKPVLTIPQAAKAAHLTFPAVTQALKRLEQAGIVQELTGRHRNRVCAYRQYVEILGEGTRPV